MTRRPEADEKIILGERSGWAGGERFYLSDLAFYLHQSPQSIRKWGKKTGLIKRLVLHCAGQGSVDYFTRYGAMRVIAHFRAWQGGEMLAGRNYHVVKDNLAKGAKRHQAERLMKQRERRARCR